MSIKKLALSLIPALCLFAASSFTAVRTEASAAEGATGAPKAVEKAKPAPKARKAAKAGEAATPAIKAAFDSSHAEVFSPTGTGDLHFSEFFSYFKKEGVEPSVNGERINAASLKALRVYVLAGPSGNLSPHEVDALVSFVEGGGGLLVLEHISEPVARLTEAFGVVSSNFVLSEAVDAIGGAPQDFTVTRFNEHPVTSGVKKVTFHGSWALLAEGGAKALALTSKDAWADINRNRKKDEGEEVGAYAVIAAAVRGKGRVVVLADDAPFANKFIKEADNAKLATNVIRWLKGE